MLFKNREALISFNSSFMISFRPICVEISTVGLIARFADFAIVVSPSKICPALPRKNTVSVMNIYSAVALNICTE